MTDFLGEADRFDYKDFMLFLEFPLTPDQSKSFNTYLKAERFLSEAYLIACGPKVTVFSDAKDLSEDIVRKLELLRNSLEYHVARVGFDNARKIFHDSLRGDPRYMGNKILSRSA